MTIYTIRPEFTIQLGALVYQGGEDVDLTDAEFELHKHKLEGVESTVIPDGQGNSNGNNGECCFPAPFISAITPNTLILGSTATINIEGSFFTPDTTVLIEGLTVQSVEFVSSALLKISLEAGNTAGFFDLTLDNGSTTILDDGLEIFEFNALVVDLRLGGTAFSSSAIEMRSGMSFSRQSSSLEFFGFNPWSSWARFVGDNNEWVWDRTEQKKITWIFRNTNSFMVGLGSFENNPTSSTQWRFGEIMGYYSSATNFYGFYGNNGTPGTVANQSNGQTLSNQSVKKLVLENNGEPGSNFYLYEIESEDLADWLNEDNLVHSGVIANNMTSNAPQIMPFCIPREGGASFLGFILEDM